MVCSVSMTTAIYYHGDLVSQMLLTPAGSQKMNKETATPNKYKIKNNYISIIYTPENKQF